MVDKRCFFVYFNQSQDNPPSGSNRASAGAIVPDYRSKDSINEKRRLVKIAFGDQVPEVTVTFWVLLNHKFQTIVSVF